MAKLGYRTALIAILLLMQGIGLFAWSATPSEPVLQAIVRFADALEAGDATRLREAVWVSDRSRAQELGRDAFVALAVAHKRLERAAAARLGNDARRFHCGYELIFSPADRQAIANATVVFDDNASARVIKPGEIWPLRVRRSAPGEWRVALDIIDIELEDDSRSLDREPNELSQLRIDRLHSIAEVVNQAAQRIEQGDLTNAAAVETEILDRLATIATDFRNKVEKLPERYRWGRDTR